MHQAAGPAGLEGGPCTPPHYAPAHSDVGDSPSVRTTAPRMRSPGPRLCLILSQATLPPALIFREAIWVSLAPPLLHPKLAGSQVSLLFLD